MFYIVSYPRSYTADEPRGGADVQGFKVGQVLSATVSDKQHEQTDA